MESTLVSNRKQVCLQLQERGRTFDNDADVVVHTLTVATLLHLFRQRSKTLTILLLCQSGHIWPQLAHPQFIGTDK